jgi:dATP/dGTP diphosphohydrolase
MTSLPTDPKERKDVPITTGVLDYFPAAIAAVAKVSLCGNRQHNGDAPLHWARGKSMDHADCIVRHLMDRGTNDGDGMRHSAKLAWRALALLQQELEAEGAPISRGSKQA